MIPGKLEITIKINELPQAKAVENGWMQFEVDCDGRVVMITLKPKIWKKLADAQANYPQPKRLVGFLLLTNPGSTEAVSKGCLCPTLDNYRGKGYLGGVKDSDGNIVFLVRSDCPLHGQTIVNASNV